MIREAIKQIVEGGYLSEEEAVAVMEQIVDGDATPSQIAGLITAMRMRGETVEEVAGFARVMRDRSIKIPTECDAADVIDTCGTGGDRSNTFNVSTTAAFVVAGAGQSVAKHGNRAMSSKCGSADVLEALGVAITLSPENVGRCIDEVSIGFMFAPSHHPSMKHAVGPRKEIGIRTVFNILGPLTNPAGASRQVIGVYEPRLTELIAGALYRLECDSAIVAHGLDGIDELSISGTTRITEIADGELRTYEMQPEDVGLKTSRMETLAQGADPTENAQIVREVLEGREGPKRDIVTLNAGAALKVTGKAASIEEGIRIARESIDTGKALTALNNLRTLSQQLAKQP